jgi:hypothetical protein
MGFMVQQVGSIPAISHNIKNKGGKKMKDGITLHPEHGLNPSIEVCMICGKEMGIALLGNNIKGQAPHHICTGGVCDDCKKIIDDGGCFIIEVEDGSDQKKDMFTKEERLFIWKEVYGIIDRLEDGEYICVALRNVVFTYFKTHKNVYEFSSDEMVRIYFPELEEKISMATEPEETRTFYGWFGCLSPETKEVRLNIVKDIIKELE